ncbi:MAG: YdeI/OmpD-associated family protein [Bacteroidota bacterium]
MKRYKTVDAFIEESGNWKDALVYLRKILNETELEETVKWGAPTYTINKKNVVGLGAFKSYAGLWFFQGALLSDKNRKLINAQKGITKALRQWRFDSVEEIKANESVIRLYVDEAIENQKKGKEIKPAKNKPLIVPVELTNRFSNDASLRESFDSLTLTKKREYAEYIASAKREETKLRRLDKIIPMILEGVGLNDKYK